jgi:hypothetical protein
MPMPMTDMIQNHPSKNIPTPCNPFIIAPSSSLSPSNNENEFHNWLGNIMGGWSDDSDDDADACTTHVEIQSPSTSRSRSSRSGGKRLADMRVRILWAFVRGQYLIVTISFLSVLVPLIKDITERVCWALSSG